MNKNTFALSLIIVAGIGLFGLSSALLAENPNLVVNGDFEKDLDNFKAMDSKGSPKGAQSFFMIDGKTKAGDNCLACLPATGKITLRQFNIALDPEKEYTLTVSLKAENAEFPDNGGVQIFNAGWTWSSKPLCPKTPTSDWADYSIDFQPRKGSSDGKYQVVIWAQSKGDFWVDNIRLVEK